MSDGVQRDSAKPVVIRAARREDADSIVAIDQASFTHPWATHVMREAVEKAQDGEYIALVAENEAVLSGFIIAWTVRDEGEIATIAVDAAWRGQGIGKRLLEAALHEAHRRGAEVMFLEVRPGNAGARHLYESCGFATVGVRKKYYSDGDDAVIMKWEAPQTA